MMTYTKEMEDVLITCSQMKEEEYNNFLSHFDTAQQEVIKQAVFMFKLVTDHDFYKATEQLVGKMVYNHFNS